MFKKYHITLFLIFFPLFLNANNNDIIKVSEEFDREGNYQDSLNLLLNNINTSEVDIRLNWRIARDTYEIGSSLKNKEEKIKYFDIGIKHTEDYLHKDIGNKRDQAELINWYTINYAEKMRLLGIFGGKESMRIVPRMFKLIEECMKVDPEYAGAYFFKAKLQEEVPFFMGGDKIMMSYNYNKAISLADGTEKMFYIYSAAIAYHNRNWDKQKKYKMFEKKGIFTDRLLSDVLDDREHSLILLKEAEKMYNKDNPSIREESIYQDIKNKIREFNR